MNDDLGDQGHHTDAYQEKIEGVESAVHDCDDGPSKTAEDQTDDRSDDECFGRTRPDQRKNKHDDDDDKMHD